LSLNPIKVSQCLHKQETLPSLLGTGWFEELILAYLNNKNCQHNPYFIIVDVLYAVRFVNKNMFKPKVASVTIK